MDGLGLDCKLNRSTLPEMIAEKLEVMILNDRTRLEQKLPSEQALALSFGVSRTVIREALVLLRGRELIYCKNGEGSYINPISSDTLTNTLNRVIKMNDISTSDIFAVRAMLENMSVRLAAENITTAEAKELLDINRRMEEAEKDCQKRAELDVEFHAKIGEISRNSLLLAIINSISSLIMEWILPSLGAPGTSASGISEHYKLIEYLRAHDTDAAEEEMRYHILRSKRNYEYVVEQNKKKESE